MARFNLFYSLFAVLVVLAVVANARPASSQPDTGNVGAMPGMAAELKGGAQGNDNADNEAAYMNDMENALEAAAKAAAKATPTTAGPRPTPGVATTAPSQASANPQAGAHASPSASAPAASAKSKGVLSNLPLVGSLMGGLPLPI